MIIISDMGGRGDYNTIRILPHSLGFVVEQTEPSEGQRFCN
jgi:hypothetical protein